MGKITIGSKEYEVQEKELHQEQLCFYEENPRVYSVMRSEGSVPTQKDIEEKMISMDHVRQLKYSIEQNGGLIDPVIVVKRDNDFIVLEGNSRLAAYRILANKDPFRWSKIRANILPNHISDDEIFTLLGQYHLVGRKDWSAFEQAAYLYRKKINSNIEESVIAKSVGLTASKVKSYINVYKFMNDNNDLRPDRWSYYEEYLKNSGIKKYRSTSEELDSVFVRAVKMGQIKQAIDVRNQLGEIAKGTDRAAKKIMKDFIENKTDLYDAYNRYRSTGKTGDSYKKIKRFREYITNKDEQKALKVELVSEKGKQSLFELKKISKAIEQMIVEYEKE